MRETNREIGKKKRPNWASILVPGTAGFSLGRVSASTHAAPARARGSNALVRSVPLCRIADILEALKNHVSSSTTHKKKPMPSRAAERRAVVFATRPKTNRIKTKLLQ